jgi:hypothetical protein
MSSYGENIIENTISSIETELKWLEDLKGCYITDAVDRDYAYRQGCNLTVFQGDL